MRRFADLLLLIGSVAIVLTIGVVHANFRGLKYSFGSQNSLAAYLFLASVFIVVSQVVGLPDDPHSSAESIGLSTLAAFMTMAFLGVVQLFRPGMLPRFVLTAAPLLLGIWGHLCSLLAQSGRRRRLQRDRVVAIVTTDEAAMLRAVAVAAFPLPEKVFSLLEVIELQNVASEEHSPPGDGSLVVAAQRAEATVIVLTEEAQLSTWIVQQAAVLHNAGSRIRTVDNFCDQWLGKLPLSSLGRMALLTDIGEVHGGPYVHIKRIVDLVAGLLLGMACVVAIPFVVIGNLFGNRGSLFFAQTRTGLRGDPFMMHKFRTMRGTDTDPDLNTDLDTSWTRPDDPRVTPFGRVLRRTHLDELPQFWNILRGELSLVGPRPEQPIYVEDLRRQLPFYDLRHTVQPGLTGWAQVKYRYAASEADALEKLQYDLFYLRHQSVSLDARVLVRTVRSVVRGRGR